MANIKRKIVWVDERTSDISMEGKPWNFQKSIDDAGYELVVCGEGEHAHESNHERAVTCLTAFKKVLDDIFKAGENESVAAFIVDIHIPVSTLGIFSDKLNDVKTNSGADTGFQIVQYILCNKRRNLSPYGDFYKNVPVLFLSISKYAELPSTKWMGKEFQPIGNGKCTQYTHLEKIFEKQLTKSVSAWVQSINTKRKSMAPEAES